VFEVVGLDVGEPLDFGSAPAGRTVLSRPALQTRSRTIIGTVSRPSQGDREISRPV